MPTLVAVKPGVGDPRSLFAKFDNPEPEPASTTYDVGLPAAGDHVSVTVLETMEPRTNPDGALGALHGPDVPTTSKTSFED